MLRRPTPPQREWTDGESPPPSSPRAPRRRTSSIEAPTAPRRPSADTPPATSTDSLPLLAYSDSERTRKFTRPVLLDLNTADSATLVRVPGVGERTASLIVDYRRRLGGFYSPRQLAERLTWDAARQHMDEWCAEWFTADEQGIQKLAVNRLSFKELLRHPYLDYEQVRQLVDFRQRHGQVGNIEALRQLGAFDDDDIARLQHYLAFD